MDGATSPFSESGPEALLRLGIDIRAPFSQIRPVLEQVFPAAAAEGYFAALRRAIAAGDVAADDADSQLRWVANHLRLKAPASSCGLPHWRRAWTAATAQTGSAPATLGAAARHVVLRELLDRPAYRARLADALAVAMRIQLTRR